MTAENRGLLAAATVAAPVALGIGYSLAAALGWAGPGGGDASRLPRVLGEAEVWRGTLWSVWVAAASTLLAAVAAIAVAAAVRGPTRSERVARAAAVVPLPIPHLVAALLGVLVLSQSGLLARWAHWFGWIDAPQQMPALIYDRWGIGMILTLAWKEFAFLVVVAWSVLAERGSALEEAARTLGVGAWQRFRWIILPVLWRGMLPAVVAVFTFVLGSYEVAALLAPSNPMPLPVLTIERYTDTDLTRRADAYVLALLGIALAALAVVLHERMRARWEGIES